MMDGILAICKEKGYTSHDVVAKLRGILHMKKIGHTGTLDPEAEGVLPIAVGRATRLVEFLTEKEKEYRAVLRLGIETDTQDMTGTILKEKEVLCTEDEIRKVCKSFLGDQLQIPPMYSALKVDGKKLYELAREGKTVERKARPVHFYSIDICSIDFPLLELSVKCSKGTYIRTLCHDIGQALGCGGCMESLLRTRSGQFVLEDSFTLNQVRAAADGGYVQELMMPVEEILKEYPRICCNDAGDRLLDNGNSLEEAFVTGERRAGWVRMCDSRGAFKGIYQWDDKKSRYCPVKMFL